VSLGIYEDRPEHSCGNKLASRTARAGEALDDHYPTLKQLVLRRLLEPKRYVSIRYRGKCWVFADFQSPGLGPGEPQVTY
jgi:hypothetical protein